MAIVNKILDKLKVHNKENYIVELKHGLRILNVMDEESRNGIITDLPYNEYDQGCIDKATLYRLYLE